MPDPNQNVQAGVFGSADMSTWFRRFSPALPSFCRPVLLAVTQKRSSMLRDGDIAMAGRISLGSRQGSYTATAMWFHWITALFMASILPIAWVMTNMSDGNAWRGLLYTLHKSIGLTIITVVVLRLIWRATHPAPPLSGRVGTAVAVLARANHWLLYAVLLVMPISGYLLSATGKFPISYFGLFTVPGLGVHPLLRHTATTVHLVGQWFVYGLVVLHLLGTSYHVVIARDGTLERMLPEQA